MHPRHLQTVLSFHFAEVIETITFTKSIKSAHQNIYKCDRYSWWYNKIQYNTVYRTLSAVSCCNYSTWKLLAWWLYVVQSGLSC